MTRQNFPTTIITQIYILAISIIRHVLSRTNAQQNCTLSINLVSQAHVRKPDLIEQEYQSSMLSINLLTTVSTGLEKKNRKK
jgi:hypothetical protein